VLKNITWSVKQMAENKMEQYCKLPIPITAYQTDKEFDIETLEGTHHASVGDWIITGVKGEQYPCKPDIFAKSYIKYGQTNKMEQVAAMFGKKLGEEFTVNRNYYLSCSTVRAKFIDKGFQVLYVSKKGRDYWTYNPDSLVDLLIGKAVIVDD
jgi:hypothetical protein